MTPANGPPNERRHYERVVYPSRRRARITIGADRFEVADITQGGIRLLAPSPGRLPSPLHATVDFIGGASLSVEARFEWCEGEQIGLSLVRLIPAEIIERERRLAILARD